MFYKPLGFPDVFALRVEAGKGWRGSLSSISWHGKSLHRHLSLPKYT